MSAQGQHGDRSGSGREGATHSPREGVAAAEPRHEGGPRPDGVFNTREPPDHRPTTVAVAVVVTVAVATVVVAAAAAAVEVVGRRTVELPFPTSSPLILSRTPSTDPVVESPSTGVVPLTSTRS